MAGRAARASTTIPPIRPRCSPSASDTPHTQPSPPRIRMLGYDWPRFHAAVNDLPAALLFVTVLFDLGAWVTKRDSLKSAAVWTLWAGVIGGWVAVLAGLQAEDVVEHGEAIHELMETHETVALTTMGIFTVVLGWKLFRRSKLTSAEEAGLRVLRVAGLVAIIWTGVLGAKPKSSSTQRPPTRLRPPRTRTRRARRPTNTNAEFGMRNAESQWDVTRHDTHPDIPHSPFRIPHFG